MAEKQEWRVSVKRQGCEVVLVGYWTSVAFRCDGENQTFLFSPRNVVCNLQNALKVQ